jgi:hypothetical protein
MKKILTVSQRIRILTGLALLFQAVLISLPVTAQVGMNKDGSQADASALLDIKGTDGGLLIPRMTTAEMNAIASPATGLMVYNTTDNTFYFYNGTAWGKVEGAAEVDGVIGNEVLNATNNGGLLRSGAGTAANPYTLGIQWGGNGTATTASRSDHSHANDHARLHAMTSAADHSATNWSIFYSNGSGQVAELPLGASGTLLQSNGASAAPSWGSGFITGTGSATRLAFWSGTNTLSSNANLYWDNNNSRLGIGTTTPSCEADVTGTQNSVLVGQASAAHMFVHLTNTAEVNGEGPGIGFSNSAVTTNIGAKICHIRTGSQSSGDLVFYTKNSTSQGDYTTEKMRITSVGNVGIGTTAPTQSLHVQGNERLTGALYDLNNDPGTSGQVLSTTGTGVDWIANPSPTGSGVANKVAFWTGANTLSYNTNFHWDNTSGFLGIGTTTPGYKLYVSETGIYTGIYGQNSYQYNGANGIYGYTNASGNATNRVAGVYGRAYGSGQPYSFGLAGHNYYDGAGVGAWSYNGDLIRAYSGDWPGGTLRFYINNSGNVYADGTYNTFKGVQAKSGENSVTLKATQSPEAWIEDFGKATLVNGVGVVALDQIYTQVAGTEDDYLVFLTPVSETPVQLYIADQTKENFTVKGVDTNGNPANCSFYYRIVARDTDSKGGRFEGVNIPDPVAVPREE